MVFTGTYELTIDSKNRVAVPSEIRAMLHAAYGKGANGVRGAGGEAEPGRSGGDAATPGTTAAGGSLYLFVTLEEGDCLCLYTEEDFERRARELDASELGKRELLVYERLKFSLSKRLEVDKQGRVRLPDDLLARVNLGKEVVVIGAKDRMEIRDRKAWNEYLASMLNNQPGILVNPRLAMGEN